MHVDDGGPGAAARADRELSARCVGHQAGDVEVDGPGACRQCRSYRQRRTNLRSGRSRRRRPAGGASPVVGLAARRLDGQPPQDSANRSRARQPRRSPRCRTATVRPAGQVGAEAAHERSPRVHAAPVVDQLARNGLSRESAGVSGRHSNTRPLDHPGDIPAAGSQVRESGSYQLPPNGTSATRQADAGHASGARILGHPVDIDTRPDLGP